MGWSTMDRATDRASHQVSYFLRTWKTRFEFKFAVQSAIKLSSIDAGSNRPDNGSHAPTCSTFMIGLEVFDRSKSRLEARRHVDGSGASQYARTHIPQRPGQCGERHRIEREHRAIERIVDQRVRPLGSQVTQLPIESRFAIHPCVRASTRRLQMQKRCVRGKDNALPCGP